MPHGAESEAIITACPHCGKTFRVAAAHVGKQAKCGCGQMFVIALRRPPHPAVASLGMSASTPAELSPNPASPAAPQPRAELPVASTGGSGPYCGVCQCPIATDETVTPCPACKARYHADCWEYNGGCGAYGCTQTPPTEKLTNLEIPAAYWGKEEKPCPNCSQMIMAAAVRCRFCGATFSSATPEGAAVYRSKEVLKSKIPGVRKAAIWLLVFSLLPCTAPLAAIIGSVWYYGNRETIRALPALHSAICKIAVGVAWVQCILLTLFGLLASLSHGAPP